MIIKVLRYSDDGDSTLGLMYIDGVFSCYVLEDEHRNEKVYGQTRIPEGVYPVKLRKEGGFHKRYMKKFTGIHVGMLEIQNVPNFEYVLIHIGNDEDDTDACLLVGNTANNNQVDAGFVGHSGDAYIQIYPNIADALLEGEEVFIHVADMEDI